MLDVSRFSLSKALKPISLTSAAATRQLTQKNVRRPQKAYFFALQERRKKQRRERWHDVGEKTNSLKKVALDPSLSGRDLIMAQLADQIFSKSHRHLATATNISFVPQGNPSTPLVAFAGRCLVGKTSLLRSLFRSSKEVGKSNRFLRRDAMNFFSVGDALNIVDLPGFGGTSLPWGNLLQYAVLLRNFSRFQPSLKMIYYCLDVNYKHGLYIQDIEMLRFLSKELPNFTIILTKGDQLIDDPKAKNTFRTSDVREELLCHNIEHPVLVTSAFRMGGIDTLRFDIVSNCLHALPTERLTYTEAKRLSERLLTIEELNTIKPCLSLPLVDGLEQEEKAVTPDSVRKNSEDLSVGVKEHESLTPNPCNTFSSDRLSLKEAVSRKMGNLSLVEYVRKTSPWRNPLYWPSNVIPTGNLKVNTMRCPGDPTNPYLFQPHFVASRGDMYFRKPNIGIRKSSRKGKFEAEKPLKSLIKEYTIPYFPEIVDVNLHPSPWMFLGSKELYFERSGGRDLGIRLTNYALEGLVNPLKQVPAPHDPSLMKEVEKLEEKRYSSIGMLAPPEKGPVSA